ncbi:hypothetical protein OESDEN_12451 [Oesophagostomum dentatum]|uniref:IBR domain-containing protein n=1 Tax=Oesophagostomum dentatum TaxID=61180 RepID=A0A0B1SV48_OESDE|nr:hypothetical protein OESDEN_12451 [Oesophagostomum dentatum]
MFSDEAKDTLEPPRVRYSISVPHEPLKIRRKGQRKVKRTSVTIDEADICLDCCDRCFTDEEVDAHSENFSAEIYELTLDDFLNAQQPSTSLQRNPSSSASSVDSSFEEVMLKPHELFDISKTLQAPHVFEIVDVQLEKLDSFDLRQEIALLLPGYCTSQWFGAERVSVSTKRGVERRFVIFFETLAKAGILRVRVNADAHFSSEKEKETLKQLLITRKNFPSLFNDLIDFIYSLDMSENCRPLNLRYRQDKEAFMGYANSENMAVLATSCYEHDQLNYIRQFYVRNGFEYISETVVGVFNLWCTPLNNPDSCCHCRSRSQTDLFLYTDGMRCRECVAAQLIRQIRLSQLPLEIPVVVPAEANAIDLLYAILPLPVMALLVKMSYLYLVSLEYPHTHLVQCPHCCTPLVVTERSEFHSCKCSSCGCCWCYLCNSEPHWPMDCEQFKLWSDKWDTHYFFAKFALEEGERVIRIPCRCGNVFYAAEHSAHRTPCGNISPKCYDEYDKEGLVRHSRGLFWKYPSWHKKEYRDPSHEFHKPVSINLPVLARSRIMC